MTETKSGSIKFHNVFMTKASFEHFPDRGEYKGVRLSLDVQTKQPEPKKLEVALAVLISTDEDPNKTVFSLETRVVGIFEELGEGGPVTLERFSTLQAPAILFPFIREAVMSITSRAPMQPVLLPPMNLAALIQNGHAKTQVTP